MTNAPVFDYWMSDIEDDAKLDEYWKIWYAAANEKKYILNLGTAAGSDQD